MSRRKSAIIRPVRPDPRFNDTTVTRFINHVMHSGKKSVAEKIVYGAMDIIKAKGNEEPLQIFFNALENISPQIAVKSRRVGGATYQVPQEVPPARRLTLAMRWLVEAARSRGKSMREALALEILDAANKRGKAVKKREDMQRMAEANKVFSHYQG